jgi:hypothetical protein
VVRGPTAVTDITIFQVRLRSSPNSKRQTPSAAGGIAALGVMCWRQQGHWGTERPPLPASSRAGPGGLSFCASRSRLEEWRTCRQHCRRADDPQRQLNSSTFDSSYSESRVISDLPRSRLSRTRLVTNLF